jgi:hypothetical protein
MPTTEPTERDLSRRLASRERQVLAQAREIAKLQAEAVTKDRVIAAYRLKREFINKPGRSTMIVKIGSEGAKWLPGPTHYAAMTTKIKHAKLDEKYNIILTHAMTQFNVQD